MVPKPNIIPTTVFLLLALFLFHCFNDVQTTEDTPEVWIEVEDSLKIDSLDVVRITTDDTLRIVLRTVFTDLIDSVSLSVNDSALKLMKDDTLYALFQTGDTGHYVIEASVWMEEEVSHRCSLTVEVAGVAPEIIRHPEPDSVWEDATLQMVVEVKGTRPVRITWYRDSTLIDSASGDTLVIDNITPSDAGNYYCIVDNGFGDPDSSDSALVNVLSYNAQFENSASEVSESDSAVTIAVELSEKAKKDVTIWVSVENISTENKDYTLDTTAVTIDKGENSAEIILNITDDELDESPETLMVTIDSVSVGRASGRLEHTVIITDNDTTIITDNDTSFTVTYKANGADDGEVPVDSGKYTAGTKMEVLGNPGKLEKKGYTFTGWNTKKDGSGTEYDAGDNVSIKSDDLTLYAQWDRIFFTITFDTDEGSEIGDQRVAYGKKVTEPDRPTRDGYLFEGWFKESSCTNEWDFSKESVTKDVTLYAGWTRVYNVTYHGNKNSGGTAPVDDNRYKKGEKVTVLSNTDGFTRECYSFIAWNTKPDGGGVERKSGATFNMSSADVKLYALWEGNPYTVNFLKNDEDATGNMEPQTIVCGKKADLTANGFSKTDHRFAGWAMSAGGEVEYENGAEYSMGTGDDTLYAKWTVITYNVIFDKNDDGATGEMEPQEIVFGETANLTTNGFVKTGYSFVGWATSADGEVEYTDEVEFTMGAGDITLYAQWKINEYIVTFNSQGGPAIDEVTVNYNDTVPVPDPPERTGHTFEGWHMDSECTLDWDFSSERVTSPVTLYADWKKVLYTVTFNSQGGSLVDEQDVYYLDTATTPSAPIRIGYTFDGWFREAECITEWVFASDEVTGNRTLYAKWTINTFNITFDKNDEGATGEMEPQQIVFGESANLTTNGFVKTGWSFSGWATSADGDVEYMDEAGFTMMTEGATLYARWLSPAGMVLIAAANESFSMGSTNGYDDEVPVHTVTFTSSFWMDTTEVKQGDYDALMATTYSGYASPSWSSTFGVGDDYPAYSVNWYDAVLYCNARTKATESEDTVYAYTSITGTPGNDCELSGLTIDLSKSGFRLPTEAQWEYACRGGTTTDYYWEKDYNPYPSTIADSNEVDEYAVWTRNSYNNGIGNPGYGTHQVATKLKNPFGLYDMTGNVWEWCNDWYASDYYASSPATDPEGPTSGSHRVCRGGSWGSDNDAISLRCTYRVYHRSPDFTYSHYGFRLLLPSR